MQRVRQEDVDAGTHLPRGRCAADEGQHDHMMRAHRLLILAGLLGCAGHTAHTAIRPIPPAPEAATAASVPSVDSLLASLTAREKIGQLIVPWLTRGFAAPAEFALPVAP